MDEIELCKHKDIYIDGIKIIPLNLWECSYCGEENGVFRIACQNCGKPRWKYIDIDLN